MNAASHPPTKRKKSGESYRRDARLSADGARHPDNPPHGGHGSCVRNSHLARASTAIASNNTSLRNESPIVLSGESGDEPLSSPEDEVQVIIPPKPCPMTDEVFTVELRTRIRAKLNKNHVSNDPLTYNKEMLRDSMVEQLIQLKAYLLMKTKIVDKDRNLGGELVQILQDTIPSAGGGVVRANRCNPAGMKKSIGKPALIDIMVDVWGVLRIVFDYRDDGKLSISSQNE